MTDAEIAAAALEAASASQPSTPAADPEHEAAVARGDVYMPPGEETIDPDALAEIADEASVPAVPVVAEVKKDEGTIPRARLNEVLEENRLLKEQLEQGKVATPAVPTPAAAPAEDPRIKIKELRRQQEDLRLEGDLEAAGQVGDQIDDLLLQTATTQAESRLQQRTTLSNTQTSMESVAAIAYEKYPFLDVNSTTVDEDAVNAVITRRNELVTSGKSLVEALQTAIDEKGPKFARLLGIVEAPPVVLTADQIRAARDKAALEKNAEASVLQPAALPSKSEKQDFSVNVKDLTPKQAAALPEEQKARLRGDVV